jgi:circadian clock protein KaiB
MAIDHGIPECGADEVMRLAAKKVLGSGICETDEAILADDHDAVGQMRDDGTELFLLRQAAFSPVCYHAPLARPWPVVVEVFHREVQLKPVANDLSIINVRARRDLSRRGLRRAVLPTSFGTDLAIGGCATTSRGGWNGTPGHRRRLDGGRKEGLLSQYILKLYVTGKTSKAEIAIANLKRICEEELDGRYELQIVDVLEHPQMAEDDKILATPTLIKRLPPPLRRVIGDLSDKHKVLLGLEVRLEDRSPTTNPPIPTTDVRRS